MGKSIFRFRSHLQIEKSQCLGPYASEGAAAHVLWVAIILFSVGLAARRQDMTSRWEREIAPLVAKLEAQLPSIDDKGQP